MKENPLVLIVDDDELMLLAAREALMGAGFRVEEADSGPQAISLFERLRPDLVLLDVDMPGMDGFEVCTQLRSLPSCRYTPILIMTGLDELAAIEKAYQSGATDFEVKPPNWLVMLHRIGYMLRAAEAVEAEAERSERERRRLKAELNELRNALQQAKLIYRSAEMDAVVSVARRVAPTDATVLITGESGTGKELLARTLHELSARRERPLVTVDCGAIPVTLIESELFGHEKGAYTGAQGRRVGRLAEANRGTVLLDEIGELPLEVQSKLLRFVQERQLVPVGGSRPQHVDTRIVAATNRDLLSEVQAGRFREDLYYRLNVVNLRIPPLRDRPDDVLHLARYFLEVYAFQYQKEVRRLAPEAEIRLLAHGWPGNVRELQNRILQAVILSEGEQLLPTDLRIGGQSSRVDVALTSSIRRFESVDADRSSAGETHSEEDVSALLGSLRELIPEVLDEVCADGQLQPVGRWLGAELVAAASEAGGGVVRQGAQLAGLAETTFRRRLEKATRELSEFQDECPQGWGRVTLLLERLVGANGAEGLPLAEEVEHALLKELVERFPGKVKPGAALLGVSAPTYRRRVAELAQPEMRAVAS